MPIEMVHYLDLTKSLCPRCMVPNTFNHLNIVHNCNAPNFKCLLDQTRRIQEAKISRKKGIAEIQKLIDPYLNKVKRCIEKTKLAKIYKA